MTHSPARPSVVTTVCGVKVAFDETIGAYPLTRCCGASAKGVGELFEGSVVCRGCYAPVPAYFGTSGWAAIEEAVRDARCPIPEECATHTEFLLRGE